MAKTIKARIEAAKAKMSNWWDDNKGKVCAGGVLALSAAVPFAIGVLVGKKNGDLNNENIKDYLKEHPVGIIRTDDSIIVQTYGVHDEPIGYYKIDNKPE